MFHALVFAVVLKASPGIVPMSGTCPPALRGEASTFLPPVAARQARKPNALERMIRTVRRFPLHTKVVLGLCLVGAILFFVAMWYKSQL